MNEEQLRLLSEISLYIRQHKFSPTYSELQAKLGYDSKGSIAYHLRHLTERGYVENNHRHRGIAITRKGQNALWSR